MFSGRGFWTAPFFFVGDGVEECGGQIIKLVEAQDFAPLQMWLFGVNLSYIFVVYFLLGNCFFYIIILYHIIYVTFGIGGCGDGGVDGELVGSGWRKW